MKRVLLAAGLIAIATAAFQSCVKKDFDAPPDLSGYDPMIPVTTTIRDLKQLNAPYNSSGGGPTFTITDDLVIKGVVTANDKSGNFYKQIVIDDSTAAIMVLLDQNSLYNDFPVGRKVYIRCKGLTLGYDGGLPELGFDPTPQRTLNEIPANRISSVVIKANTDNPVPMITVTANQVGMKGSGNSAVRNVVDSLLNRLLVIKDMQFGDYTVNYANPNATTSRDLYGCDSFMVVVRTSNYSNFANTKVPYGKGDVRGIYTVYQTSTKTPQLLLRDTMDAQFTGARCLSGPPNPAATLLSENFNSATTGVIAITGWTNFAQVGNQKYQYGTAGSTSTNGFAKISAYNTGQAVVTSWLVTPGFDLTGAQNPILTFKTARGYSQQETFKTYISTNYNPASGDPTTATWTELQATYPPAQATGYSSFLSSGNIDLSSYTGIVYIAWKYEGGTTNKTGTWELDDVFVTKTN